MRIEGHRSKVFLQISVLRIFHHTDDFNVLRRGRWTKPEPLTDRRTAREKPPRHRFTNHRHLLRLLGVLWSKAAALHQRNAHGSKEIRTDGIVSEGAALPFRNIVATTVSATGPESLIENDERERSGLHARNSLGLILNLAQQRRNFRIVILVSGG